MAQSTIAIIILASVLILYTIPRVPLAVTTILGMLAMALTGVIPYTTAYSGFSSNAVFLVAGMMVIGQACFTTGLAEVIGSLLQRTVKTNERRCVGMILLIAAALGVFLNGSLVVALLLPMIDSIVAKSGGNITRKQTYFPLGVASVIGNNLTTISATSMITAAGLYEAAGHGEIPLFAPTFINLPALVMVFALYILYGYRLQKKWFDFRDIPVVCESGPTAAVQVHSVPKMTLTGAVLVCVVVAMVAGLNYGAASLLGSCVLVLGGCIDQKTAIRGVSWTTIIIVAGAIGFSKGLHESGAGALIANTMIEMCGSLGKSPFAMCVILFIVGTVLSNFMSDNAAVAIIVPIALVISEALNTDALPLVLSTASGVKVAMATPISVAPMTQVQVAGYRFKDYVRVGGLVNLVALIVTCIAIKLVYYP